MNKERAAKIREMRLITGVEARSTLSNSTAKTRSNLARLSCMEAHFCFLRRRHARKEGQKCRS